MTVEAGKILQEGLGEVQEMIDICDFAVGLSRQLYGLTIASERPMHRMSESWLPLGPVGIITALVGGLLGAAMLSMAVGATGSAAKQAFDSIVQRDAPDANRGRSFARFETRFHAARLHGELSGEQIGGLWLEVMAESLGPAIRMNPGYEHYWAYVSHFVHSPFYVYAYAFGDLLVRSLMEKRREDPAAFTPLYENLLSAGGTRTYVEALAPFGLDLSDPKFWDRGLSMIAGFIDELEAMEKTG